jgi:hypothetical protein
MASQPSFPPDIWDSPKQIRSKRTAETRTRQPRALETSPWKPRRLETSPRKPRVQETSPRKPRIQKSSIRKPQSLELIPRRPRTQPRIPETAPRRLTPRTILPKPGFVRVAELRERNRNSDKNLGSVSLHGLFQMAVCSNGHLSKEIRTSHSGLVGSDPPKMDNRITWSRV